MSKNKYEVIAYTGGLPMQVGFKKEVLVSFGTQGQARAWVHNTFLQPTLPTFIEAEIGDLYINVQEIKFVRIVESTGQENK